jgi:hypothetical protein
MKRPVSRRSTLPIVAFAAVVGLTLSYPDAAPLTVLKFDIDVFPTAPTHAADTVTDDGLTDTADWEYADYRVSGQVPDPEDPKPVCVDAQITSGAFAFIALNRRLEDDTRCSDAGGTRRNWGAIVRGTNACDRLSQYDPQIVPEADSGGTYCVVTGLANPRIRVENLYARKVPALTNIALLMTSANPPEGHGGYEIRSEGKGTVQGNATTRVVNYHGMARLWEFQGKAKAVAESFPFNVHMTFEVSSAP